MSVDISLTIGEKPALFRVPLFSGCEFKVPEELQSSLTVHQRRGGTVRFELFLFTDPNSEVFQNQIRRLAYLSTVELNNKLPPVGHLPMKIACISSVFVRSPHLVRYILRRANSQCEACGKIPFKRFNGGEVYLEVHHITPLASGGTDSEENVMALCAECHRFAHYGDPAKWKETVMTFFAKTSKQIDTT